VDQIIYVADIDTYELLYLNTDARNLFGDRVGQTCWAALQTGQTGPCSFCTNARLLDESGHPAGVVTSELQNTVDGEWYECRDRAIPWTDGRYVRLEVASKITARRDAQAAHQRLLRDLARSEERLIQASRAGMVGHWDWDLTSGSVYISPHLNSMLGYGDHAVWSEAEEWASHIHPEDRDQASREAQAALDGTSKFYECEHRMLHRDGSVRWFLARGEVLRDESGKPVRMLGTNTEITRRRLSEEAMRAASRMEATATLAGGIAHDFNNLMVGVLGGAELLEMTVEPDPAARRILKTIASSARQAGTLAQQLLAYARGGKYMPVALDLTEVLQESIELQHSACPPGIRIVLDVPDDTWRVSADRLQMLQVLTNLFLNAFEASDGSGLITITGRNEDREDARATRFVRIAVSDTGCGMKKETLDRVFEPFFTTKFRGRGLGLAAAYGIILNHGGHIDVLSTPGRGSTFEIHLPATKDLTPLRPESGSEELRGSETILIVDDDQMVIDVTRSLLESLGYAALTAMNGQEAIDIALRHEGDIAVVLLDLRMPVMTGGEALPELKRIRPDTKVILSSGYEHDSRADALLESGASAFVQKPFNMRDLAMTIRHALA
jgi:PAS domain S-box-containing protein